MKYLIIMLMLFSQCSFAEDWDKLIRDAPSGYYDFYQINCPNVDIVVRFYSFQGSAVVYTDVLDSYKKIRRRHVINGIGCTITEFRSIWKHVLQKIRPADIYKPVVKPKPKHNAAREIEIKKKGLIRAIAGIKERLNNDKTLYLSEQIKLKDSVKVLEKQYLDLIKEEHK